MSEKSIINMPLRKVHALEILHGKKKREYRAFTDYWAKRICYFDPQNKDLATDIKWFDEIHFYPYNNKWFLNVGIKDIEWRDIDEEFIKEYGDEVEAEIGNKIFIFHLGDVKDTNLTF